MVRWNGRIADREDLVTTITLADGRAYAFEEWRDPAGELLFWLRGTPGGRLWRHPDLSLWRGLGLRAVTSRPVTSRPVTSRPVTSRPVTSRPVTSRAAL
jgi:hypothetical protein